jgi:hypothetical protein
MIEWLRKEFHEFVSDKSHKNEIIYNLTQSQVELFIRFKFAYWLSEKYDFVSCFIEVNRIDLIVKLQDNCFYIEFGHQLNLLGHSPLCLRKINNDCEKLEEKQSSLERKFKEIFQSRKAIKCTISLFTDFILEEKMNEIQSIFFQKLSNQNCGVFLKYGGKLKVKNRFEYFKNYHEELDSFQSLSFIENELALYWRIQECN